MIRPLPASLNKKDTIMIRTILAFIFLFFFLLFSIPYIGVEYLLGKKDPRASAIRQLRVVQWAFRCEAAISGAEIELKGLENIPADQPVLFVGNHLSIFDIVISYGHLPYLTGYISKDSVKKIPVLSIYMERIKCLFLKRDDLRAGMQVILKAIEYVKDGVSIFIFPEGTRNRSGDMTALAPFHDGSFKIAQKTGCPIVPVAFVNTDEIFERHLPRLKKTKVIVEFGKPVPYSDLTLEEKKQIGEHFRGIVRDMVIAGKERL